LPQFVRLLQKYSLPLCPASHGISGQPASAFHHDYLFVPENRAAEDLDVLLHFQT
jgi:hypothetical protein